MKVYSKAPDEAHARVAHLLKCFHSPLVAAGVRIDILSVADEEGESCLKLHGYPCAAVVSVVGTKERVKGAGDAEIVIDEPSYLQLSDASKDSLLDHELYHIELKIDKKGRVKLDANGRPELGMRKHDWQLGWFHEIAVRHGAASLEVRQATTLFLSEKQTMFEFAMESDTVQRLEAATAPSAQVQAVAAKIMSASPAVKAAAMNLVENLRAHNATMTIKSGNKETTIG